MSHDVTHCTLLYTHINQKWSVIHSWNFELFSKKGKATKITVENTSWHDQNVCIRMILINKFNLMHSVYNKTKTCNYFSVQAGHAYGFYCGKLKWFFSFLRPHLCVKSPLYDVREVWLPFSYRTHFRNYFLNDALNLRSTHTWLREN